MLYDDLVSSGTYLVHFGIKGQKWGVRHDPEKSINRQKLNRGKKLYDRGHTISTNADKRAQHRRIVSITANLSTAAVPIALFAVNNSDLRYSSNPFIKAFTHVPLWMIPVSGPIANAGIRAVGRILEAPYDVQDSDMRYYYNRRSVASTQDKTRSSGNEFYDFSTGRGNYDITGRESGRHQREYADRLRGRPTH